MSEEEQPESFYQLNNKLNFQILPQLSLVTEIVYPPFIITGLRIISQFYLEPERKLTDSDDEDNAQQSVLTIFVDKFIRIQTHLNRYSDQKSVNRFLLNRRFELTNRFQNWIESATKIEKSINFRRMGWNRLVINDWFKRNSNGMISDYLRDDSVNSTTQAVWMNAIYFQPKWYHPFNPELTRLRTFERIDGIKVEVEMMYQKDLYCKFYENKTCQIVEIYFHGGDFVFGIILPLVDPFFHDDLDKIQFDKTFIDIYLPKFKKQQHLNLSPLFERMGFAYPFQMMTETKVVIEEEGIEGSTKQIPKGIRNKPVFEANHTFQYYIKDHCNQIIVVYGTYDGGC